MILDQGLGVLPAGQRPNPLSNPRGGHVHQAVPRGISIDGALHMRGFELATLHEQFAVRVDEGLRDVDGIVVVLGEAQRNNHPVLRGTVLDRAHLLRVNNERVLDVLDLQNWVDGSMPGGVKRLEDSKESKGASLFTISRQDIPG